MKQDHSSSRHANELLSIEELFHGVMRSRVADGALPAPVDLPRLDLSMLGESEPRWYPVPGMYGGFSYRLTERGEGLLLTVESWSRVVEGSGRRHAITANKVNLEEEGFV